MPPKISPHIQAKLDALDPEMEVLVRRLEAIGSIASNPVEVLRIAYKMHRWIDKVWAILHEVN